MPVGASPPRAHARGSWFGAPCNPINSRRAATVRRNRPPLRRRGRSRPEPVRELPPIEALRLDERVARAEVTVADELAPAAGCPVLRRRRVAARPDRLR